MAIIKNPESDNAKVILTINNGDLATLKAIIEDWGFRDEESVFRYAIAVMSKVEAKKALFYEDAQGEKIGLSPSESVLKPVEQGAVPAT